MKKEGFQIDRTYESGDELAKDLLDRMTCDQRWLTPERMAQKAEAHAGKDLFLPWHEALPPSIRQKMTEDWGEIPGDLFVHIEKMLLAGLLNGNVFITIQPPRGYFENIDKIYHDMYLSTPHHYLAHYRWIKDVFKADAVMHVGKHGSLEWLPGKALGLSDECYPDLAIMDLPNIYPYIINDPSEGTQAKRRSYCCIIDHLTPVFTNADLYEDLAKVENFLKEYTDAQREDPGKLPILRPMIWEAVCQADLDKDLDMNEKEAFSNFDAFLEKLHSYLADLGDTMINDGLHIMGKAPESDRLVEFLAQLTRLSNGDVPSLRESILSALGYDYDELLENKGRLLPHFKGKTGGQIIQNAHETGLIMIKELEQNQFDTAVIDTVVKFCLGSKNTTAAEALRYICEVLTPNIRLVTEEIDSSLTGFNGGFVKPGPSGAPTRGQADILPTGRNFYSVDPNKIPTPGAWDVGKRLGDALIERCLKETGKYPESIGIIVWGGSTMRSKGDDIAEIYYLMGVKPVWARGSGNVTGLEVIPLSELGRPRLDVVPRISGFFRDSFPNLMERIDEAARMVAALKESPKSNILRRNVLRDVESYMKEGMSKEEAMREATFRVFGCPPGTYGAGVSELVESKNWKTQEDLGNNYIRYTAHAYGKGSYGKQKPAAFRNLLSRMDVTVKNEDSREYDMMSCTDFYNYYGGLIVASKTVRGKLPFALVGDSADPKRVKMRTTFEEAKHVLRSRLVNPKWLDGMKRHGYKGAGDISHMMDVVLGWDATAEVIDDWMYKKIAEKFALDPAMQEWMKEVNPYALQNILDKLLEAISRGMWNADKEMENNLREAYLEMEGQIEELTE
jgi:cobaltochelatase CobN